MYFCLNAAPRPVASAERAWSLGFFGSSAGGWASLGQAAAKQAVIVPMGAVLFNSAAALLAYSVTRNSSDSSSVRCQPRITVALFGSTMTRLVLGSCVFGLRSL